MSILAVPDHFYYSSLKSLQSASKLSGNEIPVLKALGANRGTLDPLTRSYFLCNLEVSSPPHPQLKSLLICFCCYFDALSTLPLLQVSAVWVTPILSSMCLLGCFQCGWVHRCCIPGPCSIPNWIPRSAFFFLLGISTSNYFFLLNSSKFSRVSWFHSQTFCFQGAEPWPEVKPDQVSSPTPLYTVWMSPHCHHSKHLLQRKPFKMHKCWRKSKNRDPRSSRGWETWGHMM